MSTIKQIPSLPVVAYLPPEGEYTYHGDHIDAYRSPKAGWLPLCKVSDALELIHAGNLEANKEQCRYPNCNHPTENLCGHSSPTSGPQDPVPAVMLMTPKEIDEIIARTSYGYESESTFRALLARAIEKEVHARYFLRDQGCRAFTTPPLPEQEPVGCSFPERDQTKPAEQQGIFRKFVVQRVDGSDQPGGKHHGCEYFVLDMVHDKHAADALRAYAESCRHSHPELSTDLIARFGTHLKPQPDQNSLTKVEPCKVCGEGNARLVVLRSCDTCLSEYAGQPEMSLTLVGEPTRSAKCEIQDPLMDEQKDAARYQHLKSIAYAGPIEVGGSHFWNIESHSIRGPSFDEAVDLAIKVLPPPENQPVGTLFTHFVLSKEDKDVCLDCVNYIEGVCRHSHGPLVPHNGKCGGKWPRHT